MKIEKINDNQIRCTLTKSDLEERHIRLSELAYGSDKAKDLFRDMMQQANTEFGFEADNIPLMIEAIPVSADSIILIISKVEDPEELDTRFSKFTPFGGSGSSSDGTGIELEGADDILDIFRKIYEAKSRAMEKQKKEKSQEAPSADQASQPSISVNLMREYTFPTLDAVIDAAHGLNNFFTGESSLYKDTQSGSYTLILHLIGTVPIYDAVVYYHKPLKEITSQEWIDIVEMHAKDGVDFMTIHVGINKATAGRFKKNKRLTNIVSRGGSIIFAWMEMTGEENPFYEHYDHILEICREYDVTLSLGDACRPGCIADAGDISQIEELVTLGELTKRAWEKDVQVIIEGPGHMALNQIEANMKIQQTLCQGAPFYVLGPLVTDIAPGYDHITAAIGGAIAAANGASFLCYVTPAEHLRLPDVDDVKEGIIASKIAAHCRRHCQRDQRRSRLGSSDEHCQEKSGLGGNVPPVHRSGKSQTLTALRQSPKKKTPAACAATSVR